MNVLRLLLRKEAIDALRDKTTLLTMLLLPLLLYPGLLLLVGAVTAAGRLQLAQEVLPVAVVGADAQGLLARAKAPERTPLLLQERGPAQAALREREVWAVVEASPGALAALDRGEQAEVTVTYTKRHDRSMEARERLRKVFDALEADARHARLVARALPLDFAEPVKLDEVDQDFQGDLGPFVVSRVLPLLLLVMLFMGALYPAVDATAGEKERGTLETLLVAPVRPLQVMAAKYLTVAALSVLASVANLLMLAITFGVGLHLENGVTVSLRLSALQVLTLLSCLVPAALMASGVALAVASLARTFKEAQSFLTPVSMVAMLPGLLALMPGIELNGWTAAVPLLNVALLIKATVLGAARWPWVLETFGSVAVCALLALKLAANAFTSEALRFGSSRGLRELFFPTKA